MTKQQQNKRNVRNPCTYCTNPNKIKQNTRYSDTNASKLIVSHRKTQNTSQNDDKTKQNNQITKQRQFKKYKILAQKTKKPKNSKIIQTNDKKTNKITQNHKIHAKWQNNKYQTTNSSKTQQQTIKLSTYKLSPQTKLNFNNLNN